MNEATAKFYEELGHHKLDLRDAAMLIDAAREYAQKDWEIVDFADDPSDAFAEWYLWQCEEATDLDLVGSNQYPQMYWPALNYDTWKRWREETDDGNNLRAMVDGRQVVVECLHPVDAATGDDQATHWTEDRYGAEQRIACGCICAECREY